MNLTCIFYIIVYKKNMNLMYLMCNSALAILCLNLSTNRMFMMFEEHDRKYKAKFEEIKKQLESKIA